MYILVQRKQQDKVTELYLKSITELTSILKQYPIEILSISICEADDELPYSDLQALFTLLTSTATSVQTLDFTDTDLDPKLFKSLSELLTGNRLTELMLCDSITNDDSFLQICRAATNSTSIKKLDLQGFSTIDDQSALALCNMIKNNSSIQELLVSNLQLEENQVLWLLDALRENPTITSFYLWDSELTKEEYRLLDEIKERNLALTALFKDKQYQHVAHYLFKAFKENDLLLAKCILTHIQISRTQIDKKNIAEQVFGEDSETLLKLIDLYLSESILGRLVVKDKNKVIEEFTNRDELLAPENKQAAEFWKKHTQKTTLILAAIRIYYPALTACDRPALAHWYSEAVAKNQRYFSADCSDDSDSDDELVLKGSKAGSSVKHKHFAEVQACQAGDFWKKTKRITPKNTPNTQINAGLTGKLSRVNPQNPKETLASAKKVITGGIKRSKIPQPAPNSTKYFIAKFRGQNYMKDRWNIPSRRFHYNMDEVGQPQFSEALLKMLPFDFYTELSVDQHYSNNAHSARLLLEGDRLKQHYQLLKTKGHFFARTVKPSKEYYIFNTVNDYLQHGFSNGINQHLLELRANRHLDILQGFPNAYNYAIATGDRPYHSLKYATGMKEYYQDNFEIRYNQDGSIINSHAGKTYVILQEASQFVTQDACNRLLPLQHTGRVPLDNLITPELETSYIGYISGEHIVYQINIKFPSFHKAYKAIYEIKYGMDLNLYGQFQRLILNTRVGSSERDAVIELLKEWLCAYHEVLLLEIAQREAKSRGGILTYVDYNNMTSGEPDMGPFTKNHTDSQNRVHMLQDIRWRLGQIYSSYLSNNQTFDFVTEVDLKTGIDLKTRMESIIKDDKEMRALACYDDHIRIPPVSVLSNAIHDKKISEEEAKMKIARDILINNPTLVFSPAKK